jgi:hypothetical protein
MSAQGPIKLIWFGHIARLSRGGGGGYFNVLIKKTHAFTAPIEAEEGESEPSVGDLHPIFDSSIVFFIYSIVRLKNSGSSEVVRKFNQCSPRGSTPERDRADKA